MLVFCRIGCPSDSETEPTQGLLEGIFREQCRNEKRCLDCAGVDGMHMSPSRGALRGTHNSKKSELRTKRAWKAQGCTENTRKTISLRSRWAPRRRRFFLISPWVAPCAATVAQRSQKPVPGTQDHQNVTSRAPKMSPGISKMESNSQKRTQMWNFVQ